jgi:hypothetical protein
MGFIYKKQNIKEKRCQYFLDTMRAAITNLMVLEEEADALLDETKIKNTIALASLNPGDPNPVLPFGDELVLNWDSLKINYSSLSKFMSLFYNSDKTNPVDKIVYDKIGNDILRPATAEIGEKSTATVAVLPQTGFKLVNGKAYFPNLEQYDYDYQSYEILNEVYRALSLILDSAEVFYSTFYTEERDVFFGIEDIPASYSDNLFQLIMVYDTRDMDTEIEGRIQTKAQEIINPTQREAVMKIYRDTRDTIKFWTMFTAAPRIEKYIEKLLFAVNGSRTYDVRFNQKLRVLEVSQLAGGTEEQKIIKHSPEEVFFPFHNKAMLGQFTKGLVEIW